MNRLAHRQDWPVLRKRPATALGTTTSRSASSRTTKGSDPPSSSTLFFAARPALAATCEPARLLPVRVTAAIRSSWIRPSTVVGHVGLRDDQGAEDAVRQAGVAEDLLDRQRAPVTFGECLRMPALPAIRAGAAKRNTCQNGKFHGMIASTVPERLVAHPAARPGGLDVLVGQEPG